MLGRPDDISSEPRVPARRADRSGVRRSTSAGRAILVVAHSARALAASARRAGFAPIAVDAFGDADTRFLALETVVLPVASPEGFDDADVVEAVETLVRRHRPIGIIYGSGFEDRPAVLAALARSTPLLGNDAQTIAHAKDPLGFAALCARGGIAHPDVSLQPPGSIQGWLVKRRGAAGGAHVREVRPSDTRVAGRYFQKYVEGRAVSALVIADGERSLVLGLSEQWTLPVPDAPYRYGGAAGPATVVDSARAEIQRAVDFAGRELALRGLCSLDFLVSDDAVTLLEINPRPGATLDIFDSAADPLLLRHLNSLKGRLDAPLRQRRARAAQVVYSGRSILARAPARWPRWSADRPAPGARVAEGEPLCTALSSAASLIAAKRLVRRRALQLAAMVGEPAT